MRLSVIGMGKLGLTMAAIHAFRGYDVIGLDVNEWLVNEVKAGRCPIYEPGLEEMMGRLNSRLQVTTSYEEAVRGSDVSFIIVPTPSGKDGKFVNDYVLSAIRGMAPALKGKGKYHLVVITSTVMPGTSENVVKPELERLTGKRCGVDFGLIYSPEFIALGNVIDGMLNPDAVLMGESDNQAGDILEGIYKKVCTNNPPIVRMSLWNAEVAKISLNVFITAKMSVAETFARVCERFPGGNVDTIVDFLGIDSRIGRRYLTAGSGWAGPCVPPSTLIQTKGGLTPISEIKHGALVLSHDGLYHPVTRLFRRHYTGDLVEITPEGFPQNKILATPEHPVWSARRLSESRSRYRRVRVVGNRQPVRLNHMIGHSGLAFLPISELRQGDILALPSLKIANYTVPSVKLRTHHSSHVKAETQLTPELMRLFGFYVAEGWTWHEEIYFSFHAREEEYVEDVSKIIAKYFGVKTIIKSRRGNGIRTRTSCSALADYLRETFGKHAYEKRFPQEWLYFPNDYLIALMQGLWYGDGSNSDGVFTFGVSSKALHNLVKLALLKLKIPYSTKEYEARVDKNGVRHRGAYHVRVCNPLYIRAMSAILPNLAIDDKGKRRKTIWYEDGMMLYHIKKVARVPYDGMVHNLEVADANSYALESGVLHNCFPRDNRAFVEFAKELGVGCPIQQAVDTFNTEYKSDVARRAMSLLRHPFNATVSILGLTYKPNTPVVEESSSLEMAREFCRAGLEVRVFDPAGMESARRELGDLGIEYAKDVAGCLRGSDLCILATPWGEFLEMKPQTFLEYMRRPMVLDCWRAWDRERFEDAGIEYHAVGVSDA